MHGSQAMSKGIGLEIMLKNEMPNELSWQVCSGTKIRIKS